MFSSMHANVHREWHLLDAGSVAASASGSLWQRILKSQLLAHTLQSVLYAHKACMLECVCVCVQARVIAGESACMCVHVCMRCACIHYVYVLCVLFLKGCRNMFTHKAHLRLKPTDMLSNSNFPFRASSLQFSSSVIVSWCLKFSTVPQHQAGYAS